MEEFYQFHPKTVGIFEVVRRDVVNLFSKKNYVILTLRRDRCCHGVQSRYSDHAQARF